MGEGSVAVYTANAGEYDVLNWVPKDCYEVDFIAFVDDPSKISGGWEARQLPDAPGTMHDRMRAKRLKALPHAYLPEYEWTIWIDANHRILTPDFPKLALPWGADAGMALHRHPFRDCIYEEAAVSMGMPKYQNEPIAEQIADYRERGHPEHWGLWAGGSIVRRNCEEINTVNELWWLHCRKWSYQDQISLPFILREEGIWPGTFPYDQYRSPWLGISGHRNDAI